MGRAAAAPTLSVTADLAPRAADEKIPGHRPYAPHYPSRWERSMRFAWVSPLVLAALGVTAAAPAAAQGTYQQQIRNQLANHSSNVRQQGYNADRDPIYGSLNDDASESMRINLNGGVRYVIIGVCDNDCSDVDLRLWGPDGGVLDDDMATDDYPTLQFVAPVSGQYRLAVMMATCNTNPCYWGVQVYSR